MFLMRIGAPGHERPVARVEADQYVDLSSVVDDVNGDFWTYGGLDLVREAVATVSLPAIDITGQRVGAPIARPQAVLCVGQNYAAHAAESGNAPPECPVIFFKHPNTIVGPYDDVRIPRGSVKTDWEVELGVVIGKRARYLNSPDDAAEHIAGITVSNDVSERDFQIGLSGGQWSKGKCCEDFNPLGPWLQPYDEVPDVQSLQLRSWVNGEERQDSSTRDMVFDVATIIYHLSQFLVLDPGDLINTGTPQGVAMSGRFPYLRAGDEMEIEIDGLGRQRQRLVDFGAKVSA